MATERYYQPGGMDSAVNLETSYLNTPEGANQITPRQRLLNTGYLAGTETPPANPADATNNAAVKARMEAERASHPGGVDPNTGYTPTGYTPYVTLYNKAGQAMNFDPKDAEYQRLTQGLTTEKPATAGDALKNQFAEAGVASSNLDSMASVADDLEQQKLALRTAADARLAKTRATINSQFDTKIAAEKVTGEKTVGGYQAQLGETRGLGFSSSRANFIDQKKADNQKYLDSLEASRQEALNNADIQSADRVATEIKDARDYQFKLNQASREEHYKFLNEQREQAAAVRTNLKEQRTQTSKEVDRLAESGIPLEQISAEDRTKFEQSAGFSPGSFEAYYDTVFSTKQAKNKEEQLDAATKINKFLETVPEGTQVPIGGMMYSGQKVGKFTLRHEYDEQSGNMATLTFDERGNLVNTQITKGVGTPKRIGGGGKGGGGGGGKPQTFEQWLEEKQQREQLTYDRNNPPVLRELTEQYNIEVKHKAPPAPKDRGAVVNEGAKYRIYADGSYEKK